MYLCADVESKKLTTKPKKETWEEKLKQELRYMLSPHFLGSMLLLLVLFYLVNP